MVPALSSARPRILLEAVDRASVAPAGTVALPVPLIVPALHVGVPLSVKSPLPESVAPLSVSDGKVCAALNVIVPAASAAKLAGAIVWLIVVVLPDRLSAPV